MTRNRTIILLAVAAVILSGLACSSFREPKPGEPGSPDTYELAWVHPRIIKADQFITLITAQQLDSFVVARSDASPDGPPTVVFTVESETCLTRAFLKASYGPYRVPLLNETLDPGVYKLSLNLNRFTTEELPSGQYTLTVQTCTSQEQVRFFRE